MPYFKLVNLWSLRGVSFVPRGSKFYILVGNEFKSVRCAQENNVITLIPSVLELKVREQAAFDFYNEKPIAF